MTPPYRLANLSSDQMSAIEHLENELGIVLIAYDRQGDARAGDPAFHEVHSAIMGGLNDDYQSGYPDLLSPF